MRLFSPLHGLLVLLLLRRASSASACDGEDVLASAVGDDVAVFAGDDGNVLA